MENTNLEEKKIVIMIESLAKNGYYPKNTEGEFENMEFKF